VKLDSLETVMARLGHKAVDLLKMDIEGKRGPSWVWRFCFVSVHTGRHTHQCLVSTLTCCRALSV
jgi:hypothetical protein